MLTARIVPLDLLVAASALLLFAAVRPHPALITIAIVAPLLTGLRLAPGWVAETLTMAVVAGAVIAAARRRRTALRPQRPTMTWPAALLAGSLVAVVDVRHAVPVLAGMALSFVTARHARDGVRRPIQLAWAGGIGGALSLFFGATGEGGVLAIAVNLALGAPVIAAFLWMAAAFCLRVIRGLKANPWDRILLGSTAAIVALVAVWGASGPLSNPGVLWPLSILFGATIARADGDAQPPLA